MVFWKKDYPHFAEQDFEKIKKQCRKSGELWVDPAFGPNETSLWEGTPKKEGIEWKRPKEIHPEAKLFLDGACEDDVNQGGIGNCWFVASVACFALHRDLMNKVLPDSEKQELDNEHYAGILLFRFYRFGEWVEVCIDDLLPTHNGALVFMHSNETAEFWPALLEKAYAKLAGSYEALDSGSSADALVDLTGGVSQYYEFAKDGIREDEAKQNKLFKDLLKALSRESLVNCSMVVGEGEGMESKRDSGLIVGHAYTVIRCYELSLGLFGMSGSHQLIKIRNPWGDTEWKGKWGDDDPKWKEISESQKKELDFTNEDDGEFWMEFGEYLEHFDDTTICRLINTGRSLTRKKWYLAEVRGTWEADLTAGGCANYDSYWFNPQIQFEVLEAEDETVQIVLCQRDRRIEDQENITIGYKIYRVADDNESKLSAKPGKAVAKTKYTDTREIYLRTQLEVGRYVIVPSTFTPNTEGDFLMKVFTEDEANVRMLE